MTDTTAGRASASSARSGVSPWVVAPTVGLAAFMEVLDISIANVALQHIAGSLSASQDESTWVLTSYLVTNAIVLPMSGWLASMIGRKRYFLGCIVGFSITSLLCGLAPSLCAADPGARPPGHHRRRPAADRAGDPRRRLPAAEARPGLRRLRHRRGLRAGDRADAGRLDHRQFRLALGFPAQRAGRHLPRRCWRCACWPKRREQIAQRKARIKAGVRLDYIGFALLVARHGRAADRARQGAGGRLVRLVLHHHPVDHRRRGARRLRRLGAAQRRSDRRSAPARQPQFRASATC